MDTKQIKYILEIANTQNFNKAAQNLFVSQPTLSYQVKTVENEIGFSLFTRGKNGVTLTPAGEQFIVTLKDIQTQLTNAIEAGQNYSAKYNDNIRIVMPVRSCLSLLPDVMRSFSKIYPKTNIVPSFDLNHGLDDFFAGNQDIAFVNIDDTLHRPDIHIYPIYVSHFYFVCTNDDAYATRKIIHETDLYDRTLMINGGSGKKLRTIQQRIINTIHCSHFNSQNHDTSLTNIAAKKAIVIAPGSLNDHSNLFTWIPFDCKETIQYALITHSTDNRETIAKFIDLMQKAYKETTMQL